MARRKGGRRRPKEGIGDRIMNKEEKLNQDKEQNKERIYKIIAEMFCQTKEQVASDMQKLQTDKNNSSTDFSTVLTKYIHQKVGSELKSNKKKRQIKFNKYAALGGLIGWFIISPLLFLNRTFMGQLLHTVIGLCVILIIGIIFGLENRRIK